MPRADQGRVDGGEAMETVAVAEARKRRRWGERIRRSLVSGFIKRRGNL